MPKKPSASLEASNTATDRDVALRLTTVMCWGAVLISVVATVIARIIAPDQIGRTIVMLSVGVVAGCGLWMVRRGWVAAAGRLVLWAQWGVMALAGVFNGGIEAPALAATVMLTAFGGILFGLRHAIAQCGATALLCVGLVVLGRYGHPAITPPPELRALVYIIISTAAGVLVWQTASILRAATAAARVEAARRARSEEALRESEERNRAIIESALDAVVISDAAGNVTGWSRQAEVMFGWGEPEMTGRSLRESILPSGSWLVHEGFLRKIATAQIVPTAERRIELIAVHRDGREFATEWSLAPVRVQGVAQWCAFVRDITARRRAEGEIRQLNSQLEQRVVERTAELSRRVTEAEQLNQELQAFSYSVSHDLRAPLRNITGFLELLVKRSAARMDAEESRYVGTVTREAARMGELINDLLDFSKVGRTEMKLERVGLTELVAEVRESLQTEIGERAVEWQVGVLPVLEGDRSLLRQVLANLLGNAVKFTRQRDPAFIEIGALPAAGDEAGLVTIFIRDNGAGFNPKYQERLFGVFQRLHSSRDFEGTGIGLANVKRIITRHGGRVWAEGAINRGATFFFTLPGSAKR